LPALASGYELVLTTTQADALTISQPNATVRITDVWNALDQDGNLSVNLSGIAADTVTLDVDVYSGNTPVTVTGQLGSTQVNVLGYAQLNISAALASGVTIGGEGQVFITGDVTTGTVDLSKVTAVSLSFDDGDNNAIDVAADATLILGAAQVLSSGADFTGAGTVSLVGVHLNEVSALGNVSATTKNITFVEAGSLLSSEVSFAGVHEITLAAGTTELTAAQAAGRVFSGLGGVTIHDANGVQSFSGTTFSDTFLGQGGDNDTVDFAKQDNQGHDISGSDTVRFSGEASDLSISGLSFGSGDNADVLDFSNLSSQLYNHNNSANGHVSSATGSLYNQVAVQEDGALWSENTSDHSMSFVPLDSSLRFTGFVAAMLDVTAENARGVASVFAISNTLNKLVDSGGDMVFLIANSAGDTNVWHWTDAGALDGNVQQAELTKLATLIGIDQTDLANIRENNLHFVV
jgi:hypothetical protein